MIECPYCGAPNTEGADTCDSCQQSLTGIHEREPASAIERGLLEDRIETLSPATPLTVAPDAKVGEVLQLMTEKSIGCVMIVEQDRLQGIFTERDALMRLNVDAAQYADRPISSVMTSKPAVLQSKDKIAFALHRMNLGGFRHVPILEDKKLVGVISIRDILAYLTARQTAE